MSRILVTRPQEDAQPLAVRLAGQGHQVLIEPLLEIVYHPAILPDASQFQALLFTSANGVRSFALCSDQRGMPVLTVGSATADAAIMAGFSDVASADGDVDALARLVAARRRPEAGPLLQLAASERAGDLAGQLTAAGFVVQREVLYEARPVRALSGAAKAALRAEAIDAALLYSPRTARAFVALLAEADLVEAARSVAAVCLSGAVAAAAAGIPWRAVRVATRPDQDALLACIDG